MAQGREVQPAYRDITQTAIGHRATPSHAYWKPEYVANLVLKGGHA
jgi:hypothetical protein